MKSSKKLIFFFLQFNLTQININETRKNVFLGFFFEVYSMCAYNINKHLTWLAFPKMFGILSDQEI